MWYVVCCLLQCPSVQYTQCSHSQASDCLPPYPLLPPTLPPPATHPMAGCQDPPAATNHRAGCLPPYPLLPPTLPPPATQPTPSCHHPMTCVRTPPSCHHSLPGHKFVVQLFNIYSFILPKFLGL